MLSCYSRYRIREDAGHFSHWNKQSGKLCFISKYVDRRAAVIKWSVSRSARLLCKETQPLSKLCQTISQTFKYTSPDGYCITFFFLRKYENYILGQNFWLWPGGSAIKEVRVVRCLRTGRTALQGLARWVFELLVDCDRNSSISPWPERRHMSCKCVGKMARGKKVKLQEAKS